MPSNPALFLSLQVHSARGDPGAAARVQGGVGVSVPGCSTDKKKLPLGRRCLHSLRCGGGVHGEQAQGASARSRCRRTGCRWPAGRVYGHLPCPGSGAVRAAAALGPRACRAGQAPRMAPGEGRK